MVIHLIAGGQPVMPIQALAQPQTGSVEALLQKMGRDSQSSTYELSFININSQGIVPIPTVTLLLMANHLHN